MKFCIIGYLLFLVWPPEVHSCGKKGSSPPPKVSKKGLTGNSLPPVNSSYFAEFQHCGMVNECKNGFACLRKKGKRRGKRSIMREYWKGNGSRFFQEGDDYVKGGTDQADYRYPWVGRLIYKEDQAWWNLLPADEGLCTVSLISSRHVLTARHCIINNGYKIGYGETQKITKKELRVVFGSITDERAAISYFVREVYMPPKLPKPQREHDLTVLRINDVVLSEKLRPICLPIYGLPFGKTIRGLKNLESVDFVGYGHSGVFQARNQISGVFEKKVMKKHLQMLSKLILDTNQRKARTKQRIGSFIDIHSKDRQVCPGDSGGPLMWQNPANGRYIILGTLFGTTVDGCYRDTNAPRHDSVFTRVPDLLPSILDYMKGGKNNLCLHERCKRGPTKQYNDGSTQVTKKTWLAKIKGYPGQTDAYESLNSPCFYQEGIDLEEEDSATIGRPRHVCPVEGDVWHRVIERKYGRHDNWLFARGADVQFTSFRECQPCGKDKNGNDIPQDWDSSHLLDEITAGSMSQPRYKGIDQPPIEPENFPDRENHPSYADVCDTRSNGENVILTCPQVSRSGDFVHKCMLAENICDGISDCDDEWDESPHICKGKCDFFQQYQYSSYNYKIPSGASSFNTISAKECHSKCLESSTCTHFSWLDNESGKCTLLTGRLSTDVRGFSVQTPNKLFNVVRGPAMCGRRDKQYNYFDCKPTVGAPYRSGIYFLQSKTGHFLSRDPSKASVILASQMYSHIASKFFYYAWRGNGNQYLNGGEWILEFNGGTSMDNSYFVIRSGVEGGHHKTQYLTGYPRFVNLTTQNGGKNFGDGYNINQRWYIEQTTPNQGFLEVKIWTKLLRRKWYLRADTLFFNEDGYNFISPTVTGNNANRASLFQLSLEENPKNTYNRRHVFRLFECDHGLATGVKFRGIKSNLHYKPVYNIKTMLEKATSGLDAQTKKNVEEGILRQVFGITHTRFEASKLQYDAFDNLINQIDLAFRDSESLIDYAGRMRIPNSGYEKLRATWIKNVKAPKSTLSHGQDFYDMCKKLVKMKYIHKFL